MSSSKSSQLIRAEDGVPQLPSQQLNAIDVNLGVQTCVVGWSMYYDYLLDETLLKESLSKALVGYPSLTGRIQPAKVALCGTEKQLTKYRMVFNNAGLTFVVQHVNSSCETLDKLQTGLIKRTSFKGFSGERADFPNTFEYIDTKAMMKGKEPLMKVRLTCFRPDKGSPTTGQCMLSLSASHIAVDGHSLMSFCMTWIRLYREMGAKRPLSTVPLAPNERSRLTMSGYQQTATTDQIKQAKLARDMAKRAANPEIPLAGASKEMGEKKVTELEVATPAPSPPSEPASQVPHQGPAATHKVVPTSEEEVIQAASKDLPSKGKGAPSYEDSSFALIHKDPLKLMRPVKVPLMRSLKVMNAARKNIDKETKSLGLKSGKLSIEVLHLNEEVVKNLKVKAGQLCGPGEFVSVNDAIAGLVWVLMCQLRRRALPGQKREGTKTPQSSFGLAIDMRGNCGDLLPMNYFGNASWAIQVAACDDEGRPTDDPAHTLAEPWRPDMSAESWDKLCQRTDLLEQSLCVASMKNRKWLDWFRSTPENGKDVLDTIELGEKGTLGTKLNLLGGLITRMDAFLTSWQFPVWLGANWGRGGPAVCQGVIHPQPIWHAMVVPAIESEGGGFYLSLTVPQEVAGRLHSSPVINALVPGARFQ